MLESVKEHIMLTVLLAVVRFALQICCRGSPQCNKNHVTNLKLASMNVSNLFLVFFFFFPPIVL